MIRKLISSTLAVNYTLLLLVNSLGGCQNMDSPSDADSSTPDFGLVPVTDTVEFHAMPQLPPEPPLAVVGTNLGAVDILGWGTDETTDEAVIIVRFDDEVLRTVRVKRPSLAAGWEGLRYSITGAGPVPVLTVVYAGYSDGTEAAILQSTESGSDVLQIESRWSTAGDPIAEKYDLNGAVYEFPAGASRTGSDPQELQNAYDASSLPGLEEQSARLEALMTSEDWTDWYIDSYGSLAGMTTAEMDGLKDRTQALCDWANVAAAACLCTVFFVGCWVPCVPGASLSAMCAVIQVGCAIAGWFGREC